MLIADVASEVNGSNRLHEKAGGSQVSFFAFWLAKDFPPVESTKFWGAD